MAPTALFTSNVSVSTDTWWPSAPWAAVSAPASAHVWMQELMAPLWSNRLDQARFHLARVRRAWEEKPLVALAPLLLRCSVALRRRSGWRARWERSPLHKRAQARRR